MCQPGRVDGGSCPTDGFGALQRATLSENVDGAVVSIDSGKATECVIEEIGSVNGQATASVNVAVRKRGRTTGLTYGTVSSVDASVTIPYGDGLGSHTLKHQVRIVADTTKSPQFSDHGDSGSAVVDASNNVVGLLFGGSSAATYANPIQRVLDELNVDLCIKQAWPLVTRPVICEPLVTRAIVCVIKTTAVSCTVVTKPVICQVVTTPVACVIQTRVCPVVTQACPPVSLACPVVPGGPGWNPVVNPAASTEPSDLYGRPASEVVDDAFWLGYYTALDALGEAEAANEE
jgi:hypothetical protein